MTGVIRRGLAPLLIAGGAIALTWVAVDRVVAISHRHNDAATLARMRPPPDGEAPVRLAAGEPIGTLEVERLGLSGVVVEGDDDAVLDRAIGHLPDTPLPWQPGNSALAAHRDALFRPLRGIRVGDALRLKTPHGDFDYVVRDTLIVKPDALWILDPTSAPTLTLISCYPFNYIGGAPERYIVRAERIPATGELASGH